MTPLTALVMGGCSGIGLGIAQSLAPDHHLILVYREDQSGAQEALEVLRRGPHLEIEVLAQPLSTAEDVSALSASVGRILTAQGPHPGRSVDILINSFGRQSHGLFLTQSANEIEDVLNEHLIIPVLLCRHFLESMYRNSFGRILNIGSISDSYVKRGQVAYATAKAGLEGLTKALAMETSGRGVTINLIRPGLIATPATEDHLEKLSNLRPNKAHILPVARWGNPSDVGGLARYLCSAQAGFITGASFTVDGGRSLGDAVL